VDARFAAIPVHRHPIQLGEELVNSSLVQADHLLSSSSSMHWAIDAIAIVPDFLHGTILSLAV
jgi:hypothetical protein